MSSMREQQPRGIGLVLCVILPLMAGCGDGGKAEPAKPTSSGASATGNAPAAPAPAPASAGDWKQSAKAAIDQGIAFLRSQQGAGGRWSFKTDAPSDVGITGLCLLAMMESPRAYRESDGPFVQQGLEWIASSQKSDGSIHTGMLATYNTSIAMLALARSGNPKYRPVLDKGLEYLRVVQSDEGEKHGPADRYHGGVGYEDEDRPDLSNTHFAIEAAQAAGMDPKDPFFKKAVVFLQRCQNRSESNDLKDQDIGVGNDGGGFYTPETDVKEAKAGLVTLPDGRKIRRSYGSMSYCLMKSYLFCSIDRRDPRVRAVGDWLSKSYRLDYNPGMEFGEKPESKFAGLFYYYLVMARAMSAAGDDLLVDEQGRPRPWRKDLASALVGLQTADGSWSNTKNPRWWENAPVLATAMATVALDACVR